MHFFFVFFLFKQVKAKSSGSRHSKKHNNLLLSIRTGGRVYVMSLSDRGADKAYNAGIRHPMMTCHVLQDFDFFAMVL